MTDQNLFSRQTILTDLNSTPQSRHLLSLLKQESVSHNPNNLVVTTVLMWAAQNLVGDKAWAQEVEGAAALADLEEPESMAQNLAQAEVLDATTLEEAAMLLLQEVADLMPPNQL